MDTGVQKEKTR